MKMLLTFIFLFVSISNAEEVVIKTNVFDRSAAWDLMANCLVNASKNHEPTEHDAAVCYNKSVDFLIKVSKDKK